MRHTFRFPKHVRDAVRRFVLDAISPLDEAHFEQEPDFTAAFLGRMTGNAYESDDAYVRFNATSITSIGKGSAEREVGADFAITATITEGQRQIRKAILVQVKLGELAELTQRERRRLDGQIHNMRMFTRSPKVMIVPIRNGIREPQMLSGIRLSDGHRAAETPLHDYFTTRVLTTLDGDTRPEFVEAVQDGSLAQLRVNASIFPAPTRLLPEALVPVFPKRRRKALA
jgi:hypothetical protein